ncbi:MAG: hypothetical protein AMXMBFR4_12210 [Candidatus Hydrogenedentota bacterium]
MRKKLVLTLIVTALAGGSAYATRGAGRPFIVAKAGQAACRIVVGENAPAATQYAAEELRRFLGQITGAEFEVVTDAAPIRKGEIILGENRHFEAATRGRGGRIDTKSFGSDGYLIRVAGDHLIIVGDEPRGTLYGVYGLLEDHLGCRWFTPAVSRIPKTSELAIGPFEQRVTPRLEYREPFVMDCFDGDWAARNRMNSSAARLEERHGGKVTYFGFVHTFEGLLPPDQHFDQHPEYYSLVNGKRLKERSQLCCTNEDVIRLVTEEVRKRMREHPDATVFSVSQNDWYNYCQCDTCTKLAEAEGSQMAPVMFLVNRVAKAVAEEFPDKLIDTLAYQYTRKPPKTMRPEPNVIIRLCSIECCFAHSFEACDSPENREFVEDVKGWSTICNRLWVWNYNTSFSNYFTPFPNLRVRNDNIKFFADHNVTGIFEQDVYTTLNGELSPLSGYLNAKLLWDPDYDEDTAINEFLEAVYGKAAPFIRKYIDLLHNRVEDFNLHMDIWIGPEHPLLNREVLVRADELWDAAEAAVSAEPEVLERVRVARLSVDFAVLKRTQSEGLAMYDIDQVNGSLTLRPEFRARAQRFFEVAERNGVTQLREGNGAVDLFRKELDSYRDVSAGSTKKSASVRGLKPGLRFKEYEGVWEALPDFGALKPIRSGIAQGVSLAVTPRREALGLEFEGYFLAPIDGVYLFHLQSNDGSKMYLHGEEFINNDGLHKFETRSSIASLQKGYHPIRVTYFESGGQESLDLSYEGPGTMKQPVPLAALWHR